MKRKHIMENLNNKVLYRMDMNNKNTCFIILKDHKENFLNNLTVCLNNPAKSNGRKININ